MFKNLDNSSLTNIRKAVGEYNDHFTKPAGDYNIISTQPYIGSQGLGTHAIDCRSQEFDGPVAIRPT